MEETQSYLHRFVRVFGSNDGKEILRDLKEQFYEPVGYDPGNTRPEDAVFYAGQRHVVAYIIHNMEAYHSLMSGDPEQG